MHRRGEIHRVLKPESVSVLSQALGGGRQVRVPSSTAYADGFEVLIGIEQTNRLIDAFGGGWVYLPLAHKRSRKGSKYGRDLSPSLDEVAERGTRSARAIAEEFGCSRRTIYGKRKRVKEREANGKPVA